jgi:hypothetical protein
VSIGLRLSTIGTDAQIRCESCGVDQDPTTICAYSFTPHDFGRNQGYHQARWLERALSWIFGYSTAGSSVRAVLLHVSCHDPYFPAPWSRPVIRRRHMADDRYEATCRFFKSRKCPPQPPRHYHNNLIDEAEEEMRALSWPELMTAGGLAGVTAWIVSHTLSRRSVFS